MYVNTFHSKFTIKAGYEYLSVKTEFITFILYIDPVAMSFYNSVSLDWPEA